MIALKHYQPVFAGSAASTVRLQLSTEVTEVDAFRVYALDNCGRLAPFPSLEADLDKLLLHANSSAYAEIFREPTSGAYFRHYFVRLLLS